MSAEIVPIGNYLPPLELEPVVLQDQPATVIVLPVVRIEREPFPRSRGQNECLPSDSEP